MIPIVFVEGDYDRTFVEHVLMLIGCSDWKVGVYQYKEKKPRKVKEYIDALEGQYIFLVDTDTAIMEDVEHAKEKKKEQIIKLYGVDGDKIIFVVHEIESWLACGISTFSNPRITKEELFHKAQKQLKKVNRRVIFQKLLEDWDLSLATKRCEEIRKFVDWLESVCK